MSSFVIGALLALFEKSFILMGGVDAFPLVERDFTNRSINLNRLGGYGACRPSSPAKKPNFFPQFAGVPAALHQFVVKVGDMMNLSRRDILWSLPVSFAFGAVLSSLQDGDWRIGWLAFSLFLLISISFLIIAIRWSAGGRALAWMVALAFILRLSAGVSTLLLLPVDGYDDDDDRAGFVFTDAHRRDEQAWQLASSDLPILDAFSQSYAYDQYGGLLAFSALIYRYFSPDMHRPLILVLISAFVAASGIPFLWKAVSQQWGMKVALSAAWIFALYPESILLGGAAMREPYLMTFSAFALWGFVSWRAKVGFDTTKSRFVDAHSNNKISVLWLALGLLGMLLVSPAVALVTLVILAGWFYFASERGRIPWWALTAAGVVFMAGLFLLSSALNRQGDIGALTPFGVVNNWLREAVKWDVYQLERGSGWIQKLFDEMPEWLRLPFVVVYGIFQPVLPAAIVEPTTTTWKVIAILRSAGWYALLPVLVYSIAAGPASGGVHDRKVWLWLASVCWAWILFTSLRGGGDQWDNPRYRAILFLWQALIAGNALVRWRATRRLAFLQVIACEIAFLLIFAQWYASRYFHWGGQLPFGGMVALILGLWALILAGGWLWQRHQAA
jgi:hypothetical protein